MHLDPLKEGYSHTLMIHQLRMFNGYDMDPSIENTIKTKLDSK